MNGACGALNAVQVAGAFLETGSAEYVLVVSGDALTDIDLRALKRPDSFLAFHVEPMLALLAPLYLAWSDVRA